MVRGPMPPPLLAATQLHCSRKHRARKPHHLAARTLPACKLTLHRRGVDPPAAVCSRPHASPRRSYAASTGEARPVPHAHHNFSRHARSACSAHRITLLRRNAGHMANFDTHTAFAGRVQPKGELACPAACTAAPPAANARGPRYGHIHASVVPVSPLSASRLPTADVAFASKRPACKPGAARSPATFPLTHLRRSTSRRAHRQGS